MEDIAWNMGAGQKGHWNNQTKTSHNQFKFFTGNHSHSESFWQRLQCFTVLYIKIYTLCFRLCMLYTGWKVSKYRVISGPYFPVFGLNTGKYGPEITPYLDTFHVVFSYTSFCGICGLIILGLKLPFRKCVAYVLSCSFTC